jgi:NitT/TauT family transport system substrate-binding protein
MPAARSIPIAAVALALAAVLAAGAARAQTAIRLGKAQANQFAFAPADVGLDTGIFKNNGINLEISAFAGDAKMVQALAAGSLDIALGGGPALASIVKGAPMRGVAAGADAPNTIMLTVLKDGPVQTVADLKGRTVSVSTVGSLTYWLVQQLSRSEGWGDSGIKIAPLGSSEAEIAALRTHQIDGVATDSVTIYKFVETGAGKILVKFGDRVKDFHVHIIYASNALMQSKPEALRAFLAGWFETISFMHDHKQATVDIVTAHTGVSPAIAAEAYDDGMPIMNPTGRFSPKALDVLGQSFVDTGTLPEKPDMSQLVTEAYLPK